MEILKARRTWSQEFWALSENNFSHRIFYPAKLSFIIDREINVFTMNKTKIIYDHKATTTEDSTRNSAHRR
jgi:hypothetical protein